MLFRGQNWRMDINAMEQTSGLQMLWDKEQKKTLPDWEVHRINSTWYLPDGKTWIMFLPSVSPI